MARSLSTGLRGLLFMSMSDLNHGIYNDFLYNYSKKVEKGMHFGREAYYG
jgi:hypothetical protein